MTVRSPRAVRGSNRALGFSAVAATAVFVELGWLLIRIGGTRGTAWFSDISGFTAPAVAAILCARTARTARTANRAGSRPGAWWALAAACGSWAAGQVAWSCYELVLGRAVPFPSLSDLGYLGMYPLALVALLLLRSDSARTVSRVRATLDGLVVGGSVLFAGWAVAIGRVLDQPAVGLVQRMLSVLYPVGDVVLCTAALTLPAGAAGLRRGRTVGLVLAGVVALGVSDLMFTYLTSTGKYATGNVVDAGWFTGFTLIGLAAVLAPHAPERAGGGRERSRSTWIYLPTLFVMVGEAQPVLGRFLALLGAAVFALVVLRQVLSTLENRQLTDDLKSRIVELRDRDDQYRLVLRATRDVIWDLDLATGQIEWGDGIRELFGYDPTPSARHDLAWWRARVHPDDVGRVSASLDAALDRGDTAWSEEYRFSAADGRWVPVMDRGFVVRSNGTPVRMVGALMDISDRKRYETELAERALHDPLTGLPNRALLLERIRAAVEGGAGAEMGLLFLDLDHFKRINDSFGHAVGDEVLVEVGRRLLDAVRGEDVVARFGGDEFVVLCRDMGDEAAAHHMVDRVLAALALPFDVGGRHLHLSASVGVALGRDVGRDGNGFLQSADTALYEAKARGRARYALFNDELGRRVRADLELTEALRQALREDGLSLAYQPVVDLVSRRTIGVEALVRWRHQEASVAPSLFIRLAEEAGLIEDLGAWVLNRSCQDVAGWGLDPDVDFTLAVNLSPLQLTDGLPARVAAALDDAGLPADRLCLEITEGALMRNRRNAMRALKRLREVGVKVAIDDFGTGYSSLSYLNRLPVDVLKIDRVFVADLVGGSRRRAITEAIIGIARAAGLTVVAEGVEDEAQADALCRLGCDQGQGFLFGRPQPGAEIRAYLAADRAATLPSP